MIDVLHRIVEARTVECVWRAVTEQMATYGFDKLIYGFTRFRTATSLGRREDMMILSNHSDAYLSRFLQEDMFYIAPMVVWASENEGAMSWAWIGENASRMTAAQEKVIEFNRNHGVVAGYTISFPDSSSRQKAAIALTAREGLNQSQVDQIWERSGCEINLVSQVAHLKMASLPFNEARQRLSPRQREVLEWVSEGKTMQDIATIMGLTPATVEKHLRKAREALNVDTTAQAVMKASMQRQLFVLEHPEAAE